jgi:hypothetical protein
MMSVVQTFISKRKGRSSYVILFAIDKVRVMLVVEAFRAGVLGGPASTTRSIYRTYRKR